LNTTPFEVLYGQKPRHLGIDVVQSCAVPDLKMWLNERHVMVQLLQQQLLRAQQRQKHQADKNRTERTFKLSFRYFGPYQIIAKVGKVAYKLLLPNSTTMHPVFHVSQLKNAIPPSFQVSPDLPHSITDDAYRFPVKVLQQRFKPHGNRPEVLI
jgi:hypothetical protein